VSANLRQYITAVFGLEQVIRSVPADSWENASPCAEWTARQVAGHALAVVGNVAARAGLGDNVDVFAVADTYAGDDPSATARTTRARLMQALDRPGALRRELSSTLGVMTVDRFLGLMLPDTLIHTWDIARATGGDERLDPELMALAFDDLRSRDEAVVRSPNRYAPPRATSATDLQSRLLAFAGRSL
jgi:uncharacterized protein (TIGR03086 family)